MTRRNPTEKDVKHKGKALLARFIRPSDADLNDMDFVGTVFARWAREAGAHLGDPNE